MEVPRVYLFAMIAVMVASFLGWFAVTVSISAVSWYSLVAEKSTEGISVAGIWLAAGPHATRQSTRIRRNDLLMASSNSHSTTDWLIHGTGLKRQMELYPRELGNSIIGHRWGKMER
jgi:hypothetical protein